MSGFVLSLLFRRFVDYGSQHVRIRSTYTQVRDQSAPAKFSLGAIHVGYFPVTYPE